MGLGDDIMLTAKLKNIKLSNPNKNVVPVLNGTLAWSPIYENNPYISKVIDSNSILVEIRPRHNVEYWDFDDKGKFCKLKEVWPAPGNIHFSEDEHQYIKKYKLPEKFVTIEPHTKKTTFGNNKEWGFAKWQNIVENFPNINFVQTGPGKKLNGDNVVLHCNDTIRVALMLINLGKFHITAEGCTGHAAAALNKKAIVIFGGLSSPGATGYKNNINFYVEHPESPCGRTYPCKHCEWCLEQIKVKDVSDEIEKLLKRYY